MFIKQIGDNLLNAKITQGLFKDQDICILSQGVNICNGLNVKLNWTSSVPKSVHHYELDKDSTSIWKLPLTNLVPQIKRLMVNES